MKRELVVITGIMIATSASASNVQIPSIYDYIVMNVCVDKLGVATEESPLECALVNQRDVIPDDLVPYVHSDYPELTRAKGCQGFGPSQRAAFPLKSYGEDQTGKRYPLIAAWTDYPPHKQPCGFGDFDSRDTATLLTVADDFASLIGAFHHKRWFLTVGSGYRSFETKGVGRFLGTWSFPATVPTLGVAGWGVFDRKTKPFSADAFDEKDFPANDPKFPLTRTIQFWKHIEYAYGTPDHRTKPLSTLLHIPFTQISTTGDAPGETRGSEHFYLTRELGYVTRWESWARDDGNKDVMGLAKKAYANQNCSLPATIEGNVTDHLTVGPVIEDPVEGVYFQTITTKNVSGVATSHRWYMTGCHDFSKVIAVAPYKPTDKVNEDTFGRNFLKQFRAHQ